MNVSFPYRALIPTLDGDVLAVLAGTTRPLTGRDVARLVARGSDRGVRLVLNRLVDEGLVDREEVGNALLYTLNREHLAFPAVEVLAGIGTELIARLRSAISKWGTPPVHASLFGSAARRDGDAHSDIDLFIVRPTEVDGDDQSWRQQLDQLSTDVRQWTGNAAAIVEISAGDAGHLVRENPSVAESLRSDAITLAGPETETLLSSTA